jgi:hypothetical protein
LLVSIKPTIEFLALSISEGKLFGLLNNAISKHFDDLKAFFNAELIDFDFEERMSVHGKRADRTIAPL